MYYRAHPAHRITLIYIFFRPLVFTSQDVCNNPIGCQLFTYLITLHYFVDGTYGGKAGFDTFTHRRAQLDNPIWYVQSLSGSVSHYEESLAWID